MRTRRLKGTRILGAGYERVVENPQSSSLFVVMSHIIGLNASTPHVIIAHQQQITRERPANNIVGRACCARVVRLTTRVVESGLAIWSGDAGSPDASLIVRGQANLLEDVTAMADLERIRALFEALETKEEMLKLLSLTDTADGVQIFIGADNTLFNVGGVSMVVDSFQNNNQQIVGAIGVIGPMRMNYARIIPMVDYTAKLIGRLIG